MNQDAAIVVVGSGLYGLVVAHQVAEDLGLPVRVIERRDHVGGNAYSFADPDTGIEVHKYGSHIFHTSNERVWSYVNRFADWVPYEHRVWTVHAGQTYSLPVNLHTMSQYFGRSLSPAEALALVGAQREAIGRAPTSFAEAATSSIGRPLFDAFFRGYTEKQWQTPASQLPASTFGRLPIRFNFDNRYFSDKYQAMPRQGYGHLLERIADHPLIDVVLNTDWLRVRDDFDDTVPVVYSGAIDEFFGYRAGRLPWRTLDFETEIHDVADYQGAPVVNYADSDVPYTRIHEFAHYPPHQRRRADATLIMREYSRHAVTGDEPYYPVSTPASEVMLRDYRGLVEAHPNPVLFGGRLGSFRYLDMHAAIGAGLSDYEAVIRPFLKHESRSLIRNRGNNRTVEDY